MTLFVFCLILFSETCSVTGQIFFKHAMSGCVGSGKARRSLNLAAGVLAMTVGFFTWLALLQRFNLSYLYPFEGLENVILAVGAGLCGTDGDQRSRRPAASGAGASGRLVHRHQLAGGHGRRGPGAPRARDMA